VVVALEKVAAVRVAFYLVLAQRLISIQFIQLLSALEGQGAVAVLAQTEVTPFFHRLQQQVAAVAAVIPAQMAALEEVLVVTVSILVLEHRDMI
jgi:hypothetical protein